MFNHLSNGDFSATDRVNDIQNYQYGSPSNWKGQTSLFSEWTRAGVNVSFSYAQQVQT